MVITCSPVAELWLRGRETTRCFRILIASRFRIRYSILSHIFTGQNKGRSLCGIKIEFGVIFWADTKNYLARLKMACYTRTVRIFQKGVAPDGKDVCQQHAYASQPPQFWWCCCFAFSECACCLSFLEFSLKATVRSSPWPFFSPQQVTSAPWPVFF